ASLKAQFANDDFGRNGCLLRASAPSLVTRSPRPPASPLPRLGLLALPAHRGLLVKGPPLHLLEQAPVGHLLLERLEGGLDLVVEHLDLHADPPPLWPARLVGHGVAGAKAIMPAVSCRAPARSHRRCRPRRARTPRWRPTRCTTAAPGGRHSGKPRAGMPRR